MTNEEYENWAAEIREQCKRSKFNVYGTPPTEATANAIASLVIALLSPLHVKEND